jgi:hypothetical protein
MSMRMRRATAVALLAVGLVTTAPASARAASAASEWGIGTTCALANLIYGPTKMMYAVFGGFIGLVAFGLSGGDDDVALRVIEPAWRGDYALTQEHLRGEKEIQFIGRRAVHEAVREPAAAGDAGDTGTSGDSGWE